MFGGVGVGSGVYGAVPEGASEVPWPQASAVDGVGLDAEPSRSSGPDARRGGIVGPDAPPGESADPDTEPGDGAAVSSGPGSGRSDDWQVDADTVEAQAVFEELDLAAAPELEAFRARFEIERNVPTVVAAIELCRAYLTASETFEDRVVLAPFLSSVIRQAAMEVEWRHAGTALTLLEECQVPAWSVDPLAEELWNPRVLSGTVAGFEALDAAGVDEFIAFSRRLGDWAIDLLGPVLVEVEGSRHQTRIIEAIAAECRSCPERLAPWLGDPRGRVVRTTVRILGAIGGDSIVGLLKAVAEHEEQAVRDELVAALKGVSPRLAKPILMGLLDSADTDTFCLILQRLGLIRDREVADLMLGYLTHPLFEQQPIEERRAVYATLGSSGTDDVLPGLEAELRNQNWFEGGQEAHRQAIARCIVQIGTPAARRVLEHGARSRRVALRNTCEEMLARFRKS